MADEQNAEDRFGQGDATYRAAGGTCGVRALVNAFYDRMDTDPRYAEIRAMHPQDLTVARDKLARFLTGWTNGPRLFSEKYGPISIPRAHAHLAIGERHREQWLRCMADALDTQPYTAELRRYLLAQLSYPAGRIVATSKDSVT